MAKVADVTNKEKLSSESCDPDDEKLSAGDKRQPESGAVSKGSSKSRKPQVVAEKDGKTGPRKTKVIKQKRPIEVIDLTLDESEHSNESTNGGHHSILLQPVKLDDIRQTKIESICEKAQSVNATFIGYRDNVKKGFLDLRLNSLGDYNKGMSVLSQITSVDKKVISAEPKPELETGIEQLLINKLEGGSGDSTELTSVFVNNIPSDARAEVLKILFPSATDIQFPTDKGGKSQGYAVLELPSKKDAESIVKHHEQYVPTIGGKTLKLHIVSNQGQKPAAGKVESKEKQPTKEKPKNPATDRKSQVVKTDKNQSQLAKKETKELADKQGSRDEKKNSTTSSSERRRSRSLSRHKSPRGGDSSQTRSRSRSPNRQDSRRSDTKSRSSPRTDSRQDRNISQSLNRRDLSPGNNYSKSNKITSKTKNDSRVAPESRWQDSKPKGPSKFAQNSLSRPGNTRWGQNVNVPVHKKQSNVRSQGIQLTRPLQTGRSLTGLDAPIGLMAAQQGTIMPQGIMMGQNMASEQQFLGARNVILGQTAMMHMQTNQLAAQVNTMHGQGNVMSAQGMKNILPGQGNALLRTPNMEPNRAVIQSNQSQFLMGQQGGFNSQAVNKLSAQPETSTGSIFRQRNLNAKDGNTTHKGIMRGGNVEMEDRDGMQNTRSQLAGATGNQMKSTFRSEKQTRLTDRDNQGRHLNVTQSRDSDRTGFGRNRGPVERNLGQRETFMSSSGSPSRNMRSTLLQQNRQKDMSPPIYNTDQTFKPQRAERQSRFSDRRESGIRQHRNDDFRSRSPINSRNTASERGYPQLKRDDQFQQQNQTELQRDSRFDRNDQNRFSGQRKLSRFDAVTNEEFNKPVSRSPVIEQEYSRYDRPDTRQSRDRDDRWMSERPHLSKDELSERPKLDKAPDLSDIRSQLLTQLHQLESGNLSNTSVLADIADKLKKVQQQQTLEQETKPLPLYGSLQDRYGVDTGRRQFDAAGRRVLPPELGRQEQFEQSDARIQRPQLVKQEQFGTSGGRVQCHELGREEQFELSAARVQRPQLVKQEQFGTSGGRVQRRELGREEQFEPSDVRIQRSELVEQELFGTSGGRVQRRELGRGEQFEPSDARMQPPELDGQAYYDPFEASRSFSPSISTRAAEDMYLQSRSRTPQTLWQDSPSIADRRTEDADNSIQTNKVTFDYGHQKHQGSRIIDDKRLADDRSNKDQLYGRFQRPSFSSQGEPYSDYTGRSASPGHRAVGDKSFDRRREPAYNTDLSDFDYSQKVTNFRGQNQRSAGEDRYGTSAGVNSTSRGRTGQGLLPDPIGHQGKNPSRWQQSNPVPLMSLNTRNPDTTQTKGGLTNTGGARSAPEKPKKVYVGNIPPSAKWDEIAKFFNREMTRRQLSSPVSFHTPVSGVVQSPDKSYAFVIFNTSDEAERAVKHLHGIVYEGRPLQVRSTQFF